MKFESNNKENIESIQPEIIAQAVEAQPIEPQFEGEHPEQTEIEQNSVELRETHFPTLESFKKHGTEKLEVLHDSEVTEQIAEYLSGIEELKYENWQRQSIEQRQIILNKIEIQIAAFEHRPPLPINVEKMDKHTFGYQSSYYHKIALNSLYVGSNEKKDYLEVIDTIIHEGRHAYQHYNVDKKLIHDSASVVNSWRENFYDPKYQYYQASTFIIPIKGKLQNVGFRLYYYQPVEIDARNFANDVMLKLKNKGFIE